MTAVILVFVGTVAGVVAFTPYLRNVLRGKTKPHTFSWLLWTALNILNFAAQLSDHAGPGAWITGGAAVLSCSVFVLSIPFGEKDIRKIDWICLSVGIFAIASWPITHGPHLSVIVAVFINVMAYIPTIRKSYLRPYEETLTPYLVGLFRWIISLVTVNETTVVTSLWAATGALLSGTFVIMVLLRRKWTLRDELLQPVIEQTRESHASDPL